jgi:hypothetical protein
MDLHPRDDWRRVHDGRSGSTERRADGFAIVRHQFDADEVSSPHYGRRKSWSRLSGQNLPVYHPSMMKRQRITIRIVGLNLNGDRPVEPERIWTKRSLTDNRKMIFRGSCRSSCLTSGLGGAAAGQQSCPEKYWNDEAHYAAARGRVFPFPSNCPHHAIKPLAHRYSR